MLKKYQPPAYDQDTTLQPSKHFPVSWTCTDEIETRIFDGDRKKKSEKMSEKEDLFVLLSKSKIRLDCESKFFLTDRLIGVGAYGSVWEACKSKDKDCKYVVKIELLGEAGVSSLEIDRETVDFVANTVLLEDEMAKLGLGPRVLDRWICPAEAPMLKGRLFSEKMQSKQPLPHRYYLFTVMERVVGTTIHELQTKHPERWQEEKHEICDKLADIVMRLHSLGIAHGDLHVNNVFVQPDGNLKLIDFQTYQFADNFTAQRWDWSKPTYYCDAFPSASKIHKLSSQDLLLILDRALRADEKQTEQWFKALKGVRFFSLRDQNRAFVLHSPLTAHNWLCNNVAAM